MNLTQRSPNLISALILGTLSLNLVFQADLALAQTELNVGASTTQPLIHEGLVLPQPPLQVRQISLDDDPAETLDQPLSLLGQQILDAVCDQQIDADRAMQLMPDLSEAHIRLSCPTQLVPKASVFPDHDMDLMSSLESI